MSLMSQCSMCSLVRCSVEAKEPSDVMSSPAQSLLLDSNERVQSVCHGSKCAFEFRGSDHFAALNKPSAFMIDIKPVPLTLVQTEPQGLRSQSGGPGPDVLLMLVLMMHKVMGVF
ncbi:hypothetical protein INR49_010188 [Caranx melampygus]|nr:hypothetical protein INR49_010188 [Caranx melampygus]